MTSKTSTGSTLGDETPDTAAQNTTLEYVQNISTAAPTRARGGTSAKTAVIDDDAEVKRLKAQGFSGERVTVNLSGARDDEQDFVFVSVNSYAFQIPRGTAVRLPVEVVEVLDNAIEMRYGKDGVGRETPRHQYSTRA